MSKQQAITVIILWFVLFFLWFILCLIVHGTMCSSRKYPYAPLEGFLFCTSSHKKFQFVASYFASKIVAFKSPFPGGISDDLPWGGYGFFLELHSEHPTHNEILSIHGFLSHAGTCETVFWSHL